MEVFILAKLLSSEVLQKLLKDFKKNIPEVESIAIVSREGLPIAAILPDKVDDIKISAMTAALLSLGERASLELNRGNMQEIMIAGSGGYIITLSAGSKAVVTVSVSEDMKLGLLYHYLKPLIQEITKTLETGG